MGVGTGIWHQVKALPEGSVVRLLDGTLGYICHHNAAEDDGSRDTCFIDDEGEHHIILSRSLVELVRLRSDLAADYIRALKAAFGKS